MQNNNDIGFIGCEPYINGIANLIDLLDEEQLKRIKIFNGDAKKIIPYFKKDIFEKIFILFPDPWPKKRHYKRRIIQNKTLTQLAKKMTSKGELRIASDDYSYVCWIMHYILKNKNLIWKAQTMMDIRKIPNNWPKTKYQEKAENKKQTSFYFKLLKE